MSFSCDAVTVQSVTVLSGTKLTALISIDADAPVQLCDVSVKTGNQLVVRRGGFQVISSWCTCSGLEPSFVRAPDTKQITLTAGCDMFTPNSEITVGINCPGVTAGSISVATTTDITVDISAEITAAYCLGDITVRSDNLTATCSEGLEIYEAECVVNAVAPGILRAGAFLPRIKIVDATLSQPLAESVSAVTFDSTERSVPVLHTKPVSDAVIRLLLYIPPSAEQGDYPFSVTAGGVVFSGGVLTIQ